MGKSFGGAYINVVLSAGKVSTAKLQARMASLVSRAVAVLAVVAVSSSGVSGSGCVECSIDREAEQDNTCVIRCYSPGKDGPSVMINGNALRTALDCDSHSIETNPYCLLRENDISVGAKIKSSSGRTLFEYNPNTELCRDKCEFSVEFNGPMCSVVREDLSKPCIKKPPPTTTEPTTTNTPSGPTTRPGDPLSDDQLLDKVYADTTNFTSVQPNQTISPFIVGGVISGIVVIAIIIAVLIGIIICLKRKQGKEGQTIPTEGKLIPLEPDGGTEKSPLIKKTE